VGCCDILQFSSGDKTGAGADVMRRVRLGVGFISSRVSSRSVVGLRVDAAGMRWALATAQSCLKFSLDLQRLAISSRLGRLSHSLATAKAGKVDTRKLNLLI
jgi:hypothetical protein